MPSVAGTVAAGHRYPSLRSVATATSTSSATMSVTSASYTTAPVAGDLLVAIVSGFQYLIGGSTAITRPSGWTQATKIDQTFSTPLPGDLLGYVWTRTATGTSADDLAISGAWVGAVALVHAVALGDSAATAVTAGTTGTSLTAPAVTTARPTALVLRGYVAMQSIAIDTPSGYTSAAGAVGTGLAGRSVSRQSVAATTASATVTLAFSSTAAVTLTLAIQ